MPPSPHPPPLKQLKPPVADASALTTREKIILLSGSKLHGCKFPPWERDPAAAEFSGAPFEDTTEFHLSAEQLKIFDSWQRPAEAAAQPPAFKSLDLVQDLATDCSVVASLCAETARAARVGQSLTLPTLHPHAAAAAAAANGKRVAKLNFNGTFRRVEIDERLPVSRTGRALHVKDRADSSVVWPALLEKAYLKVTGGYDFPGSNSGTDLWVLTGWIPEQIFLQADELVPSSLWRRLHSAFRYGDVLVTLGTGSLSRAEEALWGLAREHAYAVVGMRQVGQRRLVLVKNPWSEGGTWTGGVAEGDEIAEEEEEDEKGTQPESTAEYQPMRPGMFWMELGSLLQHFETMYLNWNPGLFTHRRDVHFAWDLAHRSRGGSFASNPQYLLRTTSAGSVWVLLSKHYASFERPAAGSTSDADGKTPTIDPRLQNGYLSLYVFESAFKVELSHGFLLRAPYVDAPNVLLRFEASANTSYTIVPSEQEMPSHSPYTFTLSAFTTFPLATFVPAPERYPYTHSQRGAWTRDSAGGAASSSTFHTNPQFKLVLTQASDLLLVLEADDNPDLAVQVKLIWATSAHGGRVPQPLTRRDVYGDSGEYWRGCALAELAQVPAGTYTVVASTFKPGQLGAFSLKVRTMCVGCTFAPLPAADQPGMFSLALPPAVLLVDVDRVLVPVRVARLTRFVARARSGLAQGGRGSGGRLTPSPLRLALEFGQGPNTIVLAATGEFAEPGHGGISTPQVDLKPQMCEEGGPGVWLVVERMGGAAGRLEEVLVEVFCDERGVTFGEWGKEVDEPIEAFEQRLRLSQK